MAVVKVLLVVFSAVILAKGESEVHKWDLAVAIDDQIELLTSNGTVIGSAVQFQFSKLKALTFDILRHQFVMSDMEKENDTIYAVRLTKEKPITPIVEDLPDDIQGLAIDAVTDVLYFSDSIKRSINHISLQDPLYKTNLFMEFEEQQPQDLAIDACRRYIYWTNSNLQKPSIERATLDAKDHQVLVTEDLFKPVGIAVDQIAQRLYWTDMGEGIYYRIESIDFTGTNRRLLYEGTHQTPFAIAVDRAAIYWTDMNNNALWRMSKPSLTDTELTAPQILKRFSDKPRGLVARDVQLQMSEECKMAMEVKEALNETSTEYFDVVTEREVFVECLNFGEPVLGGCKCKRGFTGERCETPLCHNYCLHGTCDYSSTGYPLCRCIPGYRGSRCEHRICDDYCLNGALCVVDSSHFHGIRCDCGRGFLGQRCESGASPQRMCEVFCSSGGESRDVLWNQAGTFMCRCDGDKFTLYDNLNMTSLDMAQASASLTSLANLEDDFASRLQDPAYIVIILCMVPMLISIVVLSVFVCRLRRRPKIRRPKRIIVNKNVTPLTYRPQPSLEGHCEITIENCCNMNVCETPCFEPPNLRVFQTTKKDEKKTLLSNMENGSDDLY